MGDRAVIAAWVGSTNLGDELVFSSLRRLLADRGVETAVPSIDPSGTASRHAVDAFGHFNPLALRKNLQAADALVFGGGGLLQDETSIWNLPWHLSRIRAGRRVGLPWAGVGLGAAGLTTTRGRRQVAETFCDHVAVAVRDAQSANLLTNLGVPRVIRAADLGWLAPPPVRQGSGVLAVCLRDPQSARWWPGALPLRPITRTPDATVDALAKKIDAAVAATGLTTRFVALDATRDHPLHQRVADRMATPVDTRCPTLDGLLNEFADVNAAITMRYHGAVAAALGGAPVVPLAFSPKLTALAEDLGSAAVLINNLNDLPGAVNKALAGNRYLPEAVGQLTDLAGRNATVIEDLLGAL